jgi:hypothetical protein
VPEGAVYVYGVVAADDERTLSAPGVTGSRVRTVGHAGLAALVSDLDAGELTAANEVRAHWRVLEEASKSATVLPVRFGTVLESDRAVCEQLLESNGERLGGLLRELAGRVQLTLKGDYDEELLLREVVRRSPAIAALRERLRTVPDAAGYYDRIRLGELVAGEVARCREADEKLAFERLEPHAAAVRTEPPGGEHGAFNLACLVERERVDAFSQAVAALGEELGDRITLRYLGPMPPFSFAEANAGWG